MWILKMGFWSGFKKSFDFIFYIRPKKWFGWDSFKSTTLKTYDSIKNIYTIPTPSRIESFNQAVMRHQLTENQIDKIKNRFYCFSIFFMAWAIAIMIYAFEGFWQQQLMKGVVSLSLVCFLLAQAFRYHFWYFQICQKKLGCTFTDWLVFIKS